MTTPERLKTDLVMAMRDRDKVRMSTIRTLIAAIDNAGAVAVEGQGLADEPKRGLGHDVDRRHVSNAEITSIVAAERDELIAARDEYRELGETRLAEELERMVEIAGEYLA